METVLKRRPLEVCVFFYLDAGLRCGDVYVEGSEAYADYRQQLLPWAECVPRLPAYCQALQFAPPRRICRRAARAPAGGRPGSMRRTPPTPL